MCRKEIIARTSAQEVSEQQLQKYKLYYDCRLFCQYCGQPEFEK